MFCQTRANTSSTRRAHVEHVERTARHVEHTSSTRRARRARKADRQKIPKSEVFCKSCNFFSKKGAFFFPNSSNFRAALPENGSTTAIFWHQVAKRNRWQGQDFKTPEKKSQVRALACRNLNSHVKKMSFEWGEAEEQIIDMKESGRRESEREKSRQREEKKERRGRESRWENLRERRAGRGQRKRERERQTDRQTDRQ